MKKLIILGILMLHPAYAISDEACNMLSSYATTVMEGRQAGVPIASMVQTIDNTPMKKLEKSIFKSIVIDAYSRPRFSTNEYIAREITEFTNSIYLQCLKVNQNNN